MGDDEHGGAGMGGGDLEEHLLDPRAHRLVGLPLLPAETARPPARGAGRKPRFDLGGRQPGPLADVDLAQASVELDRQLERLGDDLGRLARARQIGAVDRVDPARGEELSERPGLRAPGLVQRRVGVPLPAPLAVPVGLGRDGRGGASSSRRLR